MRKVFYLTGATGWVGNEILKLLLSKNEEVVLLIRKETEQIKAIKDKVSLVFGDIRDEKAVEEFLNTKKEKDVKQIVIHCAAQISIKDSYDKSLFDTNYFGTKLVADLSLKNKVERFIYISSTEALKDNGKLTESFEFEDNPEKGCYSISKSMAVTYIKKLCDKGLNGVILHPSGIIGPDNVKGGELTALVNSFLRGLVPASIKDGSYNLVDVRDVAEMAVVATTKGRVGENYIIAGKSMQITDFLNFIADKYNRKRIKIKLHSWFIKLVAPLYSFFCKIFRLKPLYTKTAIATVIHNRDFDCSKAKKELGYSPRNIEQSIVDMCDDIIAKDKRCLKGRRPLTLRGRLLILAGGLLTFAILFSIRYIPGVAEVYSRTVGRYIAFGLGHAFSWIPFSIFEISLYLIVISIILWIVFFIIHTAKKSIKKSFTRIIDLGIVLSSCLVCYAMTFGVAYYRDAPSVPQHTELLEDTSIYRDIAMYYEEDFNKVANELTFDENGSVVNPYSWDELNELVKQEFTLLDGDDYYNWFTLNGKPMYMTSWLYTEFQITGITFPATYEPNYNINVTAAEIPFTLAHELAHSKGAMREEDANLVAAYVCLNSKNAYIKYSAYMYTFFSLGNLVKATNVEQDYVDYLKGVDPKIWNDVSYMNKFWKEHDLLGDIGDFINNIYLRISANESTDSYIDHDDSGESQEGGKTVYKIYSYSPYQALMIYNYLHR